MSLVTDMYLLGRGFQTEISASNPETVRSSCNGRDTVNTVIIRQMPLDLSMPNKRHASQHSEKDCTVNLSHAPMFQRNKIESTSTATFGVFSCSFQGPKSFDVFCRGDQGKTTRELTSFSHADVIYSQEDHIDFCNRLRFQHSSSSAQTSCFAVFPTTRYIDINNPFQTRRISSLLYGSNSKDILQPIPVYPKDTIRSHTTDMQALLRADSVPGTCTSLPYTNVTWTPSSVTFQGLPPYQHHSLPLKYPYSNNLISPRSDLGRICTDEWLLSQESRIDKSLSLTKCLKLPMNTDNGPVQSDHTGCHPSLNKMAVSRYHSLHNSGFVLASNVDHLRSASHLDSDNHSLFEQYPNVGPSILHGGMIGFASGISPDSQTHKLHLLNTYDNPVVSSLEAQQHSQTTNENMKLPSNWRTIQNKLVPAESFTTSSFLDNHGSLGSHVQETDGDQSHLYSARSILPPPCGKSNDNTAAADEFQENNLDFFSRGKDINFSRAERMHRESGGMYCTKPVQHVPYIGYSDLVRNPLAFHENHNQSPMTLPSDLRSNVDPELKWIPSKKSKNKDIEKRYDECLPDLKIKVERTRPHDKRLDNDLISRATDVLNSQTSCSSLTALRQLQSDKPVAEQHINFGKCVHEMDLRCREITGSYKENPPVFFLQMQNNKQSERKTSPRQENMEIFKCNKTDQENEFTCLEFDSKKEGTTVRNRGSSRSINPPSNLDVGRQFLPQSLSVDGRLSTRRDLQKYTSFQEYGKPMGCKLFTQKRPLVSHNSLTSMETTETQNEGWFVSTGTSAKRLKTSSDANRCKSTNGNQLCASIKEEICSGYGEDGFQGDYVENASSQTSEISALPNSSNNVLGGNLSFVIKTQDDRTETVCKKVPNVQLFSQPYPDLRATEKTNQTGSDRELPYTLEDFAKKKPESNFRTAKKSSTKAETRRVQETPTKKVHTYQCKDCKSCCLTFSALLQHQSSGCFAALPNFAKVHASDCLGKHGRYDNSNPGDKCECTPCSLCGGIFSSKFKVFSHYKRGCYRPRDKVKRGKPSPTIYSYTSGDLASQSYTKVDFNDMECKDKPKGKRKSTSSYSNPKSEEHDRGNRPASQESTNSWNRSKTSFTQDSAKALLFRGDMPNKSSHMRQGDHGHGNRPAISYDTEVRKSLSQVLSQEN